MSFHYRPAAFMHLNERPVIVPEHCDFETVAPGNIRVTGTWMMHPSRPTSQPCLVLTDARKPFVPGRVVPIIIPLSEAWRWMEDVGSIEDSMRTVRDWIALGWLPGSPSNNADLILAYDAVQCRLRDLIAMTPMPEAPAVKYGVRDAQTVAELTITDRATGAVVQEIEVTAHV